ncbi:NAD(P)-binding protein [Hypoxylon crocopeplum]|nr:NAD(P)-binding protein [Hypoxylon crocopeplum]
MASPNTNKTIAFFGASTGVGLAALTRALAAGYTCVALCRTPSKLVDRFPAAQHPNLCIVEGNAHDAAVVARCLTVDNRPVDAIVSSIGGVFVFSRMTLDDPHVCENGITALHEAIAKVREQCGEEGWTPRVVVLSTCGLSTAGRDYPLATLPIYKIMLKVPHVDKRAMEKAVVEGEKRLGYTYTIVRPSLLSDDAAPQKEIRVGVDDDFVVGYAISRDDTGRWIYENLLDQKVEMGKYENRVVTLTW